jgi:hypothetical protein
MTYPTELKEHHWLVLQPILEKIESLPSGEIAFFTYPSSQGRERARQFFYAWRQIENKTHLFKMKTISPKTFAIEKLSLEEPSITGGDLLPYEEFVIENLLDITDEKKALDCIQNSTLTPKEKVECVLEWRKVIAKD